MNPALLTHLKELRKRFIYSLVSILVFMFFCYGLYDYIYTLLSGPFAILNTSRTPFYINSVLEGVLLKLKFSFLFGLIFSLPIIIYHGLRFSLPGLTHKERRVMASAIIAATVMAGCSFFYSYFVVVPLSLQFLMSQHFIPHNVGVLLTYSDSLLFVFNILLYLMMMFQCPILLLVLLYLKVLKRAVLWRMSRYVVVLIVVVAALATPPDVVSQVLLAGPLIVLYFLVILFAKLTRMG